MIRVLILLAILSAGAMAANLAVQRWHCGQAWSDCKPLCFVPCELVDAVLAEREELERRAGARSTR